MVVDEIEIVAFYPSSSVKEAHAAHCLVSVGASQALDDENGSGAPDPSEDFDPSIR